MIWQVDTQHAVVVCLIGLSEQGQRAGVISKLILFFLAVDTLFGAKRRGYPGRLSNKGRQLVDNWLNGRENLNARGATPVQ